MPEQRLVDERTAECSRYHQMRIPRTKPAIYAFLLVLYCTGMGALLLVAALGCAKPVVWAEGTPEKGDHVINNARVP